MNGSENWTDITTHPVSISLNLREVWKYRELLFFLSWRDLKIRYKQTLIGAAWAIVQPFMTMVVFSIFLGHLAKVPSDKLPYPIFSYAALVPWMFFAGSLSRASNCLILEAPLIKRVYFPKLLLPLVPFIPGLVDFILAFLVLIGMMIGYGIYPTARLIYLPLLLLLAVLASLSISLWLAPLNARFRDIMHVVPFLIQLWMFATPVAYPGSLLPEPWRTWYGINPMTGVVEGFRWVLLGTNTTPGSMIALSSCVTGLLLIGGYLYFKKHEDLLADIL